MASFSIPAPAVLMTQWVPLNCFNSSQLCFSKFHSPSLFFAKSNFIDEISANCRLHGNPFFLHSAQFDAPNLVPEAESEYDRTEDFRSTEEYAEEEERQAPEMVASGRTRRRRRYRKKHPGEERGITEEMRFVAMKLRNSANNKSKGNSADNENEREEAGNEGRKEDNSGENIENGSGETWQPSMEGFLKYLVDSKLVFSTVERIVDESTDVSYVYFRKTGLERSGCISRDLEWLREQGNDIPQPSKPGVTYAQYLVELADRSPPLFLCHLYNINFSHIAGGQVIAKQVAKKLLGGRDLAFYSWEGDAEELLKGFREKLNALAENWTRDEKNKCLREATKAFRFLGQIARLIIL